MGNTYVGSPILLLRKYCREQFEPGNKVKIGLQSNGPLLAMDVYMPSAHT